MLYLNKQSQMASFMPSASDKKRLSRENKQQLTSHTQHLTQQEEPTLALCYVLSHGSAPKPEATRLQTPLAVLSFTEVMNHGRSLPKELIFLVQILSFAEEQSIKQ